MYKVKFYMGEEKGSETYRGKETRVYTVKPISTKLVS